MYQVSVKRNFNILWTTLIYSGQCFPFLVKDRIGVAFNREKLSNRDILISIIIIIIIIVINIIIISLRTISQQQCDKSPTSR